MADIALELENDFKDTLPLPKEVTHPVCKKCVNCARQKYNGFTGGEGTYYEDGFSVGCSFIPENGQYIDNRLKEHCTEEEWLELNSYKNPLLWAMRNLKDPDSGKPWTPWPYQKAPLLCSSPRMVLRWGRRTGKSTVLAALIIWFLFTDGGGLKDPKTGKVRKNLKILLIAPQKSHVSNIFDRVRAFLALSPHLQSCIKRDKRGSPELIALRGEGTSTGNQIVGFASGDASGSKGLSARGQDADLILLDEGAFVSEEVILNVVNPILYTRSTTRLIVSSTPSGIAGDYFEGLCKRRPKYVEFYSPATERPDWAEVEDQIRKDFGGSQDEWDKEVLALFPIAGIGVYKESLIKLAQSDYEYGDLKPDQGLIYTIGVDWNKEHGTEIVVTGTERASPHNTWDVWAETIPKKDFTTPMGIDKLVALNRYWQPALIYVDEGGGGSACVQMLHFMGRAARGRNILDARLVDIVKSYDFGSKVEIQDHDGQMVKKPAKPFLVETSVHKFETQTFRYPRGDTILTKQLNNYIVVRRTPAGLPVYGMKERKWGDHRVDALNLALIAVRLEIPSLNENQSVLYSSNIGYVPDKDGPSGNVPNRGYATISANAGRGLENAPDRLGNARIGNVNASWGSREPTEAELARAARKPRRGSHYGKGRTWRR